MGQPAWIPTPEILEKAEDLASRGLTRDQIADCLGIGSSTLYFKQNDYPEFADAIKRGQSKGIEIVANALFENAISGNTTAQIFYMKARAKWSDHDDAKDDSGIKSDLNDIKGLISKCVKPIP